MVERLWVYVKRMYPPWLTIPGVVLQYMGLHVFINGIYDTQRIVLGWDVIAAVLTVFFFLLFLRISDDLKDRSVDPLLFPDRPFPSGLVEEADLWVLWGAVIASMCFLNILRSAALPVFCVLLLYGLAMHNYFFMRKLIAENLLLAFLTHNPVSFLIAFYIAAIALHLLAVEYLIIFKAWVWGAAFWFWGFGMIWEVSRKVRAPGYETDYQTYSMLCGYRLATMLVLLMVLIQAAFLVLSSRALQLHRWSILLIVAFSAFIGWFYLRFLLSPRPERAALRPIAEIHMIVQPLILSADLLTSRAIVWI